MKKRYFIAEGPKAEQVVKEGLAKAQEAGERLQAFLTKYKADTTWGRRDRAAHVAYLSPRGSELPEVPGLKFQDYRYAGGDRYALFSPDKRTKVGKEIRAEMDKLRLFDFSSFAVKEFDVYRDVVGRDGNSPSGMSLFLSCAGRIKGQLVFQIPFPDESEGGGGGGGGIHGQYAVLETETEKFTIPECFREIKKSEYIALTEE